MGRPFILSEKDRQRLIQDYNSGVNCSILSRQYMLDRSAIITFLKKQGVYVLHQRKHYFPPENRSIKDIIPAVPHVPEGRTPLKYEDLLKENERETPRDYASYCKQKKINLKKYLRFQDFTPAEKLKNRTGANFF